MRAGKLRPRGRGKDRKYRPNQQRVTLQNSCRLQFPNLKCQRRDQVPDLAALCGNIHEDDAKPPTFTTYVNQRLAFFPPACRPRWIASRATRSSIGLARESRRRSARL